MKLNLPPKLVEKLVWVPVISFCKNLHCWWLLIWWPVIVLKPFVRSFSPPNGVTLWITLFCEMWVPFWALTRVRGKKKHKVLFLRPLRGSYDKLLLVSTPTHKFFTMGKWCGLERTNSHGIESWGDGWWVDYKHISIDFQFPILTTVVSLTTYLLTTH
jgi:hypothetical protein